MQLTDDWVRTTFPELAGVEDLRSQLMQGAQIYALETVSFQGSTHLHLSLCRLT